MKFKTIDIEADGLSAKVNQKLFPEGNHFDPGSVIWCVTICDQDYRTVTLVHKLPETPRPVKSGYYTKAVHYRDTEVPKSVDGHKVVEYTDMKDFIRNICCCIYGKVPVYCKGYWDGKELYNYDRMVLEANIDRYGCLGMTVAGKIEALRFDDWTETPRQVHTGQFVDNATYMTNGIRHNIEDAIQLAKRINNREVIL